MPIRSCAPSAAGAGPWSGRCSRAGRRCAPWAPMRSQTDRPTWPAARLQSLCAAKASAGGSSSGWRTNSRQKASSLFSSAPPNGCTSIPASASKNWASMRAMKRPQSKIGGGSLHLKNNKKPKGSNMSMLSHFFDFKPEVLALDEQAMELCQPYFRHMEEIRDFNQLKMLKAFADTQMSSTDMLGTTGYGLWDTGRAKLEQIFAEVMGAEDALVRSQFQSGTHTLAVALFGLLRAGDTLLAATGRPYDTLEGVIGLDGKGKGTGTLMDYGVKYDEVPLKPDFTPDYDLIAQKAPGAKVCHIQRSRGYLQRNAFDLATIRKIADTARAANPEIIVFVDNCYGEFTQTEEPCQAGADLVVGSLIKNPGGGIAPTGGYIAGRKDLVELCAYRLNFSSLPNKSIKPCTSWNTDHV